MGQGSTLQRNTRDRPPPDSRHAPLSALPEVGSHRRFYFWQGGFFVPIGAGCYGNLRIAYQRHFCQCLPRDVLPTVRFGINHVS